VKPIDPQGYPGAIGEDGTFDGGDTAAIMGTVYALGKDFPSVLQYPFNNGAPIRHPDTTKWYGQPDRFSRDQLIPVLCDLVANDSVIPLLETSHRKKYFLTAWNTKKNGAMDVPDKKPDITGPTVWALWLRYKRPWWARLVLGLCDLQAFVSALDWRFRRKGRVCRNHMLVSVIAYKYMPTWISQCTYRLNNWDDLISRWDAHCEAVREYNTAELFREAIKK
jgi:hypothetical protein